MNASTGSTGATASSWRGREALRFLIATLAVTALYLAIQHAWLEIARIVALHGWLAGNPQVELAEEAREVATRSVAAEAKLKPQHRAAAWRLGLELGYASERLGLYLKQPDEAMRELSKPVAANLARARELSRFLGVGPVAPLPVRTGRELATIRQRMEADEWGLADRVEAATSARDRHLFLLGLHVGVTWAELEGKLEELPLPVPPSKLIGRHATLAGVPPAAWEPLTRFDTAGGKLAARAAYWEATLALDRRLAPSER